MGDEEGGEKGTGGGFREAESCIARNEEGTEKEKERERKEEEEEEEVDGWTELRLLGMNSRRGLSGREIDFHGWGLAVRTL